MFVAVLILLVGGFLVYRYSFRIESRAWIHAHCRGENVGHKVALTFDDSSHPIYTAEVLDVLKRHEVKACFFMIGAHVEEQLLRRMMDEGHIVGNHTFEHRGMGPFASTERMIDEAKRCDARIHDITGHRPRLFRPPFGVSNPMIGRMVKAQQYEVVGWSVRSLDTLGEEHEKVLERIERQLHDGAIILLHDNRQGAGKLLEGVLGLLQRKGYEVERVDKLLNISAYKDED